MRLQRRGKSTGGGRKRARTGYRGFITVYLALVTGILLSLFVTLLEASRRDLIRMQIECVTDMALQSALAQYHRQMLEQYDLFFIDTSYGTPDPSFHRTEEKITGYLTENFTLAERFGIAGAADLTGLSVEDVQLLTAGVATDEDCSVLKYHAVQYMKDRYGISAAEAFLKPADALAGSGYTGDRMEAEWDRAEEQLKEEILSAGRLQDAEWNGSIPETPADAVRPARSEGILSSVIKGNRISTASIVKAQMPSDRVCNTGTGLAAGKQAADSLVDRGLFCGYILEKCGFYGAEKSDSALAYQVEYILQGHERDQDNLRDTARELLWIREAANVAFLFSGSFRQPAADTALLITGLLGVPELAELMTDVILFAWAYAESVKDVRILLAGGKVPLFKMEDNWNTPYAELLTYRAHLDKWNNCEEGMTYREYLGALLFLCDDSTTAWRLADMMECDLKLTPGNSDFRIDGMIDGMSAQIDVISSYGGSWQITREYGFE